MKLSLRAIPIAIGRSNLMIPAKGYFFLLITMVLLAGCGNNEEKKVSIPDNILPREKMAQVITDIHIAEAEMNLHSLPDSTSKTPISFRKIFEKDSITKQQYEESLTFYIDHPELLDKVYEEVLNEMSKMQGQAEK